MSVLKRSYVLVFICGFLPRKTIHPFTKVAHESKTLNLKTLNPPSFVEESRRENTAEKKREIYIILLFFAFTALLWPHDFEQKREETLFSKAEKR